MSRHYYPHRAYCLSNLVVARRSRAHSLNHPRSLVEEHVVDEIAVGRLVVVVVAAGAAAVYMLAWILLLDRDTNLLIPLILCKLIGLGLILLLLLSLLFSTRR